MSRYRVLAQVVGVVSLSCSAQVQAANKIWANPVTGSWATAANWTGGVPTATDSATFNKAGAYTVNFSAVFQNTQNISLTAGTVTFERIATPATLNLGNYELAVSSGTLNLGHSLPVNVSASRTSVFSGTLTVNAGSYLNTYNLYNDGSLLVGSPLYGTGALGAYEEMIVGNYGIGTLAISNGGDVTDDNSLVAHEPIIADQVGSFGDVTVTGAGSTWTMSRNLVVGRLGVGALTVSNGGFVSVAAGAGQVNVSSISRINVGEGGLAGSIQAAVIVNNGNLSFNHTDAVTINAAISGNGRVYKAGGGAGNTTLANAAAFTGDYYVQSGRLILPGNVTGRSYVATSGGTLRFAGSTLNLGDISLQAGSGGNMEYLGTDVRGGFLRGPGTHTILSGGSETRFTGVTTFNSTHIVQNGNATFTNFNNGGSFVSNATANFDGVVNGSSGIITINNELSAQDFTNNGIVTVNGGGTLYTGDSNLVSGGGSRTTINPGGVVFLSDDTSWELNGALLINNGELYGTTNVNYGSLAKGDGVYGVVNVYDGGSFSPGNSPGEVTVDAASFNAGGKYVFEINDAAGMSGVDFDLTTVAGQLSIAAGTTANSKFTIDLVSLNASNQAGAAANFVAGQPYSFVLATAAGGIVGFSPDQFQVDSSRFVNNLGAGSYSITQAANNLLLNFTPTPAQLLGDYNDNGVVDAADYVVWRKGLGTTYTQNDYDVWRANFGHSAGSGADIGLANTLHATVPEPSMITLIVLGLICSAIPRLRVIDARGVIVGKQERAVLLLENVRKRYRFRSLAQTKNLMHQSSELTRF